MLHRQVGWKVVCEVVGVSTWICSTHGADDLLTPARVSMLLGDVLSKLCLREAQLGAQWTCEGLRLVWSVTLTTVEQV